MISVGYNPAMQTSPQTAPQPEVKEYSEEVLYPQLSKPAKDGFKKITGGQIQDIKKTPQVTRSDCYLVSSLKALAKSGFGKQMLKKSIKTSADGDTFEVQFNKYDGKNSYKISQSTSYEAVSGRSRFNPIGAVEHASNCLYQDKFSSKPAYVRAYSGITMQGIPLEYNLASYFMKNLTGKDPIALGDESLRSLSSKKEEATALLDKIGDYPINRHSFVAGSKLKGTKDGIGTMHYYVIKGVDKDKKEVHLVNPRYVDFSKEGAEKEFEIDMKNDGVVDEKEMADLKNNVKNMPKVYKLSYDQFLNNFRSMVGYFDEKVVKDKK